MIRIYNRQPDIWESILPPNLRELPKELKLIDEILSDPGFTNPFEKKLISYEGLLEDVSYSIAKRRFCGFSLTEPLPDDTTLIKLTHKLGEDFIKELFNATIKESHKRELIQGKKSRIDTFVLKSNIHYPTDASLLYDGIRVLGNLGRRLKTLLPSIKERSYNYTRKAKRILLNLTLNKNSSTTNKEGMPISKTKVLQEKLIHLAEKSILKSRRLIEGSREILKDKEALLKKPHDKMIHFTELTEKVVSQTREVLSGVTHIKDRIVSIFDTGARPIKKGKTFPKVEFGRKVLIAEGENGIVIHLQAFEGNPNDHTLLVDAIKRQGDVLERIPESIATDRGFYDTSHVSEKELKALGVIHISIPRRGYKDHRQKVRERSKYFRDLQRDGGLHRKPRSPIL